MEGCKYCSSETSEIEVTIRDVEDSCKWCAEEGCYNYEDVCIGAGYSSIPVNYCPNCGKKLN